TDPPGMSLFKAWLSIVTRRRDPSAPRTRARALPPVPADSCRPSLRASTSHYPIRTLDFERSGRVHQWANPGDIARAPIATARSLARDDTLFARALIITLMQL